MPREFRLSLTLDGDIGLDGKNKTFIEIEQIYYYAQHLLHPQAAHQRTA